MKYIRVILILSFLIVFSCKQADANAEVQRDLPISTFDSPFPKNNKSLSNIIGNLLTIKSGNDTLTLKITSTKNENLIINSKTGDTVFHGTVCKYRDLYYFNEKINDSSYYISALKIKGNLIYGLYDRWSQLYEVDDIIIKGNNKKLVKFISRDTTKIRLHVDKKELKDLFNSIINSVIPDTIINYDESNFEVINEIEPKTQPENDENENVIKVYPNPATDFINIELKHRIKSSFQFIDLNGRTILQGQLNELVNRIEIGNQKNGIYLLKIINLEKNESETIKIAIKK